MVDGFWNKDGITRREFMGAAAGAAAGIAAAGLSARALASMAPIPADAVAENAVINAGAAGQFKILQVTDLHFHFVAREIFGEPQKTESIQSMVDIFKPDMIANTGDFWASNANGMGADMCKWSCKEFAKFKTPWAFAWGNHDEANDYDRAHAILKKAPYSLYRGDAADGNYRVEVRAAGGETPLWNLIFLNDSRGGFRQEQIDWFNAEAARIRKQTPNPPPALLFFHIPLPQYDDAAKDGIAVGVKFESVCHEDGSREAFGAFRDAGFVRGMFCGHDHVNDYYAITDGMRMQYGRALGGYGEDKVRKGGTLITLDTASNAFDVVSVFPDGTSWKQEGFAATPEPGRVY